MTGGPLTAAELASMRADLEAVALPDTCNVLSVTNTVDGQGGVTQTWGTLYAGTACRLDPILQTGREQPTGGAVQDYKSYNLFVPYNLPLTEAHRVEVNSVTFSVTSVDRGKSYAVDKKAIVERI